MYVPKFEEEMDSGYKLKMTTIIICILQHLLLGHKIMK